MESLKPLGYLYVITGIIGIIGAVVATLWMYGYIGTPLSDETIDLLHQSGTIGLLLPLLWVSAIATTWAGVGLLHNLRGAWTMTLILGFLSLFSFPVGTFIGVYTLWKLFKKPSQERLP
jgi:zinc transporter ZupT